MGSELETRNRNANRSGRSPACWTESTKVNGAEGAVNTERRTAPRRKGDDIAERLLDLGAAVIKLLPALGRRPGGKPIVKQLERCGPAGGSNYEEARGAESPADFVHKTRIALNRSGRRLAKLAGVQAGPRARARRSPRAVKEVRETRYWLRLAARAELLDRTHHLALLIDEADQLVAILTASANTAR